VAANQVHFLELLVDSVREGRGSKIIRSLGLEIIVYTPSIRLPGNGPTVISSTSGSNIKLV
jgi:hypothetical protein